jgi:hypothetical protein
MEKHTKQVQLVLAKFREHGLYAKSEKCKFDRTSIKFLGYVAFVQAHGVPIVCHWLKLVCKDLLEKTRINENEKEDKMKKTIKYQILRDSEYKSIKDWH